MKRLFCGLLSLMITIESIRSRIITPGPGKLYIKKFHQPSARSLRQIHPISREVSSSEYSFNDKITTTRAAFLRRVKGRKLGLGRLLGAEDINIDFPKKVDEGVKRGCAQSKCTGKMQGGIFLVTSAEGVPIVQFSLAVRASKDKDDHNITIKAENYDFKSEFQEKKMKGLAIIEADETHREEIIDFAASVVNEFADEGEEQVEHDGLAKLGQALKDILKKDKEIKPVVEDPLKGYMFEHRTPEGFTMVVAFAYELVPEVYEVKIMTHTMDELSMQFRGVVQEPEVKNLEAEINTLLAASKGIKPPTLPEVSKTLNGLFSGIKGADKTLVAKDCPAIKLVAAPGVDHTMYYAIDVPVVPDNEPQPVCMFIQGYVMMMYIMDLPYVFFSFNNERMQVEHFVPAIDGKVTIAKLTKAWNDILQLNISVETSINENLDADGFQIDNPKEFKIVDLLDFVEKKAKAAKLTVEKNVDNETLFAKEGTNVRISIEPFDSGYRVTLQLPHKAYKGDKEHISTNEFNFSKGMKYDAIKVFEKTLDEFLKDLAASRKVRRLLKE